MKKKWCFRKSSFAISHKKTKKFAISQKKFSKPAFVALKVHLALMSTEKCFTTKRKRKQLQILLSTKWFFTTGVSKFCLKMQNLDDRSVFIEGNIMSKNTDFISDQK